MFDSSPIVLPSLLVCVGSSVVSGERNAMRSVLPSPPGALGAAKAGSAGQAARPGSEASSGRRRKAASGLRLLAVVDVQHVPVLVPEQRPLETDQPGVGHVGV